MDQGARTILSQRLLEIVDSDDLRWPEAGGTEGWQLLETTPQRRDALCCESRPAKITRAIISLGQPGCQCVRPMEAEHRATARLRIEAVREVTDRAVGLEEKRQRAPVRRQIVGKPGGVLGRLRLDARQRAFGLGLNRAHGLSIEVEQIVRKAKARLQLKLAHGDAATRGQIQIAEILNLPARSRQVRIDRDGPSVLECRASWGVSGRLNPVTLSSRARG